MNYFNSLAELDIVEPVHLSEKGSQQIKEFKDFATPLLGDIRKGDAAKAKIAEYYLEHKAEYTDGAVKILEPLVEQLGVSKGYISQVKQAKEFKGALHHNGLSQWVSEHPVSVQYYLTRIPHQDLMSKYMTGEHFSKREAQETIRVNQVTEVRPVEEPTKTAFQLQQEKEAKMVEDEEYPLIRSNAGARSYMNGTRKGRIEACAQTLLDMKYKPGNSESDQELRRMLGGLRKLLDRVEGLPVFEPKSLSDS